MRRSPVPKTEIEGRNRLINDTNRTPEDTGSHIRIQRMILVFVCVLQIAFRQARTEVESSACPRLRKKDELVKEC